MTPAEVVVLAERLAGPRWSWDVALLPPILGELGLRLALTSGSRLDLRRASGEKAGQVVLDQAGLATEMSLNVTELADPDDEADLLRLADEVERLTVEMERRFGPAFRSDGTAAWSLDGARLELRRLFVVARLALVRDDASVRTPAPAAVEELDEAWAKVGNGLLRLIAGLEGGEVVELAVPDRFHLQVGRVPEAIWLLASGPPTPDLEVGAVDKPAADHLETLGFDPPGEGEVSWRYAVDLPADPLHVELAAGAAVDALRQAGGAATPSDLVSSTIVAGPATEQRASRLGVPRNPYQAG